MRYQYYDFAGYAPTTEQAVVCVNKTHTDVIQMAKLRLKLFGIEKVCTDRLRNFSNQLNETEFHSAVTEVVEDTIYWETGGTH